MSLEHALDERGFLLAKLDNLISWAQAGSLWPMPMGLACCAIEMMAAAGPKYDIARFGMERFSFSPRQADVMIVAGWCTYKMAHAIKRLWDQVAELKRLFGIIAS